MRRILYHGTLVEHGMKIYQEKKFIHSNGEKHLLGKGIYFYDDPVHALVWAKMKAKQYDTRPLVLKVTINVEEEHYLDLDMRENQDMFFLSRKRFLDSLQNHRIKAYYTDSRMCDLISNETYDKMLAKTFVYTLSRKDGLLPVRYTNDKRTDRNITRHFRTEKQYCLKTDDWIHNITIWEYIET